MKKIIWILVIVLILAVFGAGLYLWKYSDKNKLSGCETVSPNPTEGNGLPIGFSKYKCYTLLAVNETDVSICENIADLSMRESCYANVAGAKGDISICSKISDKGIKDTCYLQVAYKNKDYSICDNYFSGQMVDGCKLGVKIRIGNS